MQRDQEKPILPSDVLLHTFSFLNNKDRCAVRQLSQHFKKLIDSMHLDSLFHFSEEERLYYLIKLCLEISTLKKSGLSVSYENKCIQTIENYLEKANPTILSTALANTALAMLYIHINNPDPEKTALCESRLQFALKMLAARRSNYQKVLVDVLIALVKKKQGDFCSYLEITTDSFFVSTGITLDEHNDHLSKKIYRMLIQDIPLPIDHQINTPLKDKIQSALHTMANGSLIKFLIDHLKNNWQQLSAEETNALIDQLHRELNNPLYPPDSVLLSCNQQSALKILFAIWPQLPEGKKDQILNDIINMIETKTFVSSYLIDAASHLTAKNRDAIYLYGINNFKKYNILLRLLSAISPYLSLEQQHELHGSIQGIPEDNFSALPLRWRTLTEEKQSALLEKLLKSHCGIKVNILLELKNTNHLREEQNNKLLNYFIATYANTARENPDPAPLLDNIWLFANSLPCKINLIMADKYVAIIPTCKLTGYHDLTSQLPHAGQSQITPQERCETAKKVIDYFCQQALNLDALRKLKNQFEQLHSVQALAYLAARHHHFGISISLHQWTNTQYTGENKTYNCSKEWTECMAIFQEHMLPYKNEWNEEDNYFMQLSGSGWQDWRVNFSR